MDLRSVLTFVAGLPHGMVHETNQDGFYLSRHRNKRYTALKGQSTSRFLK